MIVTQGSTNVTVPFNFVDDVGGTNPGEPTTGLLFSDIETGGSASYQRQGAARVDFTLITLASASAAHADGGFILVDDTEMAGVYRCDIPDLAVASGVDFVIVYLRAASAKNTLTRPLKIDLTTMDFRDGVRGGLTALPNAEADAALGLPVSDAGGLDLDAKLANTNEVTAVRMATLTDWIDGGRLDLIIDAIPTTAMRGTDGANTTVPLAAASTATLSNQTTILNRLGDFVGTGLNTVKGFFQALFRKDAGVSGANLPSEINEIENTITGNYDATKESQEAFRDRGDAAWITATGFSTHNAAAVWTSSTRTLTANTNFNDPTAATIADAIWNEAQADHVAAGSFGLIATEIASILVDTAEIGAAGAGLTGITGAKLAATGLDLVLIDGKTLPVATQIIAAACIGIVSGAGSGTEVFKGLDKTTTRATVTVDTSGNRSAIVYV